MKHSIGLILIIAALPLFAANPPCVLDPAVLSPYDRGANATLEEMAASRRAVSTFLGCDPANIDMRSRKLFFEVVEREFNADPRPHLAMWSRRYPDSSALHSGIATYQHELRDFMDRMFDPRRDVAYRDTVLRFGRAKAIASLGPAAVPDVRYMLGRPNHVYGIASVYNGQTEALAAIGFWIDPTNGAFTKPEKRQLTNVLTSLVGKSENIRGGRNRMLVEAALKALARSDDPHAETTIRHWMDKQNDKTSSLYRLAAASADAIKKTANK